MNTITDYDGMKVPEHDVRYWRDVVFESHSSDSNWSHCRDGWMTPENVDWLRNRANLILREWAN